MVRSSFNLGALVIPLWRIMNAWPSGVVVGRLGAEGGMRGFVLSVEIKGGVIGNFGARSPDVVSLAVLA